MLPPAAKRATKPAASCMLCATKMPSRIPIPALATSGPQRLVVREMGNRAPLPAARKHALSDRDGERVIHRDPA